jgi:alkylhydroperoxidase family enzyme
MTASARVPRTRLTGWKGGLLKLAIRKKLGEIPESVEVMWNHPALFMDMSRMGGKTEKWDRLDRNLASFAVMAAAAEIDCQFCLDLNYFTVHNKGLDEDKAREVPRWRESQVFSALERRVMEYAEAMCQTPLAVTDEMSAKLLADLGPDGLLELTARIGFMNLAARTNVALGIRSEHFSDSCGLQPIASRPTRAPAR